jgi:hypothetical protein
MCIFEPRGHNLLGYPPCCAISFEEIPHSFVLNVYLWLLCIIKWSKSGRYFNTINIWLKIHQFDLKFGSFLLKIPVFIPGWFFFWVSCILKVNLKHFNGQNTPKNPGLDIKIVILHNLAAKLFHFLILPVMADVGHLEFTVLLIFRFEACRSSNPYSVGYFSWKNGAFNTCS